VHLVNYRPDGPIRDVRVLLRVPAGRSVKSVTLADPERQADADLDFRENDGAVEFTIPAVKTYAIAVVTWRS